MRNMAFAIGIAASAFIAGSAQAATISISTFTDAQFTALSSGGIVEDFESYQNVRWVDGTGTNVGTFSTLGGSGSGTVCQANTGRPCTTLAIQRGSNSGQGNLVPFDGVQALSSNDTLGIAWNAFTRAGTLFSQVVFGLRDAADIRNTVFTITAGGQTTTLSPGGNNNGRLVVINFGENVSSALIEMRTTRNDGFTLDGATIIPSPVPLPASSLLLLGGLAALGAAARRKKAVKA